MRFGHDSYSICEIALNAELLEWIFWAHSGANLRERDHKMIAYRTTELELASFLKARGYRLTDARMDGRFVSFEFEPAASCDVSNYFSGAQTPARELFEAHRSLRALIQQVKEHSSQKIGTENSHHEYAAYHRR